MTDVAWTYGTGCSLGRFEKNEIQPRIINHVVSIEIHKNKHYDIFVFAFRGKTYA